MITVHYNLSSVSQTPGCMSPSSRYMVFFLDNAKKPENNINNDDQPNQVYYGTHNTYRLLNSIVFSKTSWKNVNFCDPLRPRDKYISFFGRCLLIPFAEQ